MASRTFVGSGRGSFPACHAGIGGTHRHEGGARRFFDFGDYPHFQQGMPENYLARFRQRSCSPLRAVAPPHSAVISMSAPVADIALPSRITVAAIAIARSVRPDQATLRAMAIAAT